MKNLFLFLTLTIGLISFNSCSKQSEVPEACKSVIVDSIGNQTNICSLSVILDSVFNDSSLQTGKQYSLDTTTLTFTNIPSSVVDENQTYVMKNSTLGSPDENGAWYVNGDTIFTIQGQVDRVEYVFYNKNNNVIYMQILSLNQNINGKYIKFVSF